MLPHSLRNLIPPCHILSLRRYPPHTLPQPLTDLQYDSTDHTPKQALDSTPKQALDSYHASPNQLMSYIKQNLMAGEQIIYEAELHWVSLLMPLLSMLIGLSILLSTFVADSISEFLPFVTPNLLTYGGLSCFVSATASFLWASIRFYTSEFAVTNKKVIAKRGFISRSTQELLLDRVEGIAVQQGVLGRLLDYGTIIVTGTGTARALFSNIANPLQFQQQLQDELFAQQKGNQANMKP